MQLISGQSNFPLAQKIATEIGARMLATRVDNFNDGELRIQVMDRIGKEVVIVQSTSYPVNNHLMELLLLADTVKRAGAQSIIALIPYFGYSRQDRCTYKFGPISAGLVIKLLEAAGITKVITLDLHSPQLEGMFNIPVINLDPASLFFPEVQSDDNVVVVSPDIGGIARARNFGSLLSKDIAIINKSRDHNNECHMSTVIGEVRGKKCILIDDMVDSADTLCKATDLLTQNGALEVIAFASHAVFSGDAVSKIVKTVIKNLYVSDSIYHSELPGKIRVISAATLLATALTHDL